MTKGHFIKNYHENFSVKNKNILYLQNLQVEKYQEQVLANYTTLNLTLKGEKMPSIVVGNNEVKLGL